MKNSLAEQGKKIKNLKICAAVLTAISGGFTLIPHPIAQGMGIALGLAGVLVGLNGGMEEAHYFEIPRRETRPPRGTVALR